MSKDDCAGKDSGFPALSLGLGFWGLGGRVGFFYDPFCLVPSRQARQILLAVKSVKKVSRKF